MPDEYRFIFPLPNGLHARPASRLEEVARPFSATITLVNDRTGRSASLRSVLGMVGTDTRRGDPCRLMFTGEDRNEARVRLTAFLTSDFLQCDEPLAAEAPSAGEVAIPRSLRAAGLERSHAGLPACPGLGIGAAVVLSGAARWNEAAQDEKAADPGGEIVRFEGAHQKLQADYEHDSAQSGREGVAAAVLKAQLGLLRDPLLVEQITGRIRAGQTARSAVVAAIEAQSAMLRSMESAYLHERVLDLEDIGARLLEKLGDAPAGDPMPVLTHPAVVVAETLSPSRLLELDRRFLRGLVLGQAGLTSHTVILARSFGVPTLVGVARATSMVHNDETVIVDANLGLFLPTAAAGVRRFYEREQRRLDEGARALAAYRDRPGATADGRRLEIGANVAMSTEAASVFAQGAEGIGLFRTELQFADRATAPTEDEHYAHYAAVVQAAAGRPVIFRTFDIGGDKPVPFLPMPAEKNPFLGWRGVRWYEQQAELVKAQLRALWRAAALGPVKVMVPMVACLEEALLAKRLFTEAGAEVQAAGVACGGSVPFGLMLEVPSSAFILDELCTVADFFSIGTNDLAQYFHAADRENPRVSALHSHFHPGFLRLLRQLVEGARARGRWIGLCGAMAEDPAAWPLLAGLGLDEVSVPAPLIGRIKRALARLDSTACTALLERMLRGPTLADVRQQLTAPAAKAEPLLAPALVRIGLEGTTKAEVIRELAGMLQLAGRTDAPDAIEAAVWQREDISSTGFGEGFAIPHGQSDRLHANSIVVARLREPVDWQSLDGRPVDVVVMLAVRASEHGKEHLKVLARLSRLVMQEPFREALRGAADADALTAYVRQRLEMA